MSKQVYVDCAQGYTRTPFTTEEDAQAWIDRMIAHHERDPRMCAGPHTIRVDKMADGSPVQA